MQEYARQVMLQQMQQAALYQQLATQQLSNDTQLALLQQQQLLQRQLRQGAQGEFDVCLTTSSAARLG